MFSQSDLLLTCGSWVLGGRWLGGDEKEKERKKGEKFSLPPRVCDQVAALAEGLATDDALVWLFS